MTLGELLTLAAYLVGAAVFLAEARRRKVATEGMGYVALAGFCGGVLGAKVTEWALHGATLSAFDPRLGGRALIGGLLCGWLAVEIAKWRLGIRRSTGDLFALALPAGEGVGRLGCFFNGCCYGVPSDVAWAVYQHGAWRHPAQLYMAAWAGLLGVTLWAWRDKMPREGDLFRLYLVLFGLGRFALEFGRERRIVWGGLSTAQWVCLEIAVSVALMWAWSRTRPTPWQEKTT